MIEIFNQKFYENYETRAENEALKKTIKSLMHILSRLINASIVTPDLLENCIIPIFSRVERNLDDKSEYFNDISYMNRKCNDSLTMKIGSKSPEIEPTIMSRTTISDNKITIRLTNEKNRQESYV